MQNTVYRRPAMNVKCVNHLIMPAFSYFNAASTMKAVGTTYPSKISSEPKKNAKIKPNIYFKHSGLTYHILIQ